MAHILPQKSSLAQFKYQRYYEVDNDVVRIFGKCEVTDKDHEMFVPTADFYNFLQQNSTIGNTLKNTPKEEREFILSGTSPEGWDLLYNSEELGY